MTEARMIYFTTATTWMWLRRHVKDETTYLVYLDPPFNSTRLYNVLFAEQKAKPVGLTDTGL